MFYRLVLSMLFIPSAAAVVLADDYDTDYENVFAMATDFTFPYTSLNDFGFISLGTGATSNRIYQNDNSGIDIHTTAAFPRYQTLAIQRNDGALRTKALSATPMKLKWRSAPINSSVVQRMEVIGFGSSAVMGPGYATTGSHACVCFRVDVTTTNVPLSAVTKDGASSETVTKTDLLEVLDQDEIFEIIATNSRVEFYINGSLVATHTTKLPTAGLVPIWGVYNREAKSKGVSVEWVRFQSAR
jgi:hypothetical protein